MALDRADLSFRRARRADASRVRDLFCRSYADTFGHIYRPGVMEGWFETSCTLARFEADCTADDTAVFLGEDRDGGLLGHCIMGPYDIEPDTTKRWWTLRQLYVEERAKGTGLAQTLLDMGIAEARARGFEELYLTAWVDNHRALRFYQRNGFVEVGRYQFMVGDQADDDKILRLTL